MKALRQEQLKQRSRLRKALMQEARKRGTSQRNGETLVGLASRLNPEVSTKGQMYSWLAERVGETLVKGTNAQPRKVARRAALVSTVSSDEFYNSRAWQAVRFKALRASNGACCLCGRSNRMHGVILHVDHVKPRSKYPRLALTLSNLQVFCEDCNLGKGNTDDTDWRALTEDDEAVLRLDRVNWRTF